MIAAIAAALFFGLFAFFFARSRELAASNQRERTVYEDEIERLEKALEELQSREREQFDRLLAREGFKPILAHNQSPKPTDEPPKEYANPAQAAVASAQARWERFSQEWDEAETRDYPREPELEPSEQGAAQ